MVETNGVTPDKSSFLKLDTVPCVLDNKPWEGLSKTYDLKDPHSPEGKVLYKVNCVNADEATKAVESAAKAFKTWKKASAFTKRAIFLKALNLLEQRKEEYVKLATEETTGNQFWAVVDWQLGWNVISETAALATALHGSIVPSEDGQRAYVERIPYGVVLGIAPWNAPFVLGVRAFANAIMAGNTVVFKTSEFSPKIHTFAAQLFADAGLPEGVLNLVHVSPEDAPQVIENIIAHPAVRKINFTGSTVTGSKIAQVAAKYVKPAVMELGGKAPLVVMKDANLKAAANAAVFGGLSHSGQICMASDGLIVHEDIADEFIKVLSGLISDRKASANPEGFTDWRGMFSKVHADRVTGLINDALEKGAKIVIGKAQTDYNIVQPIILEGTTPEMKIYSEEIFGPALTLTRFKTIEEAIEISNRSEYGLAASIYGSNETECFALAQEIESGQVHINGATVHDTQVVPHGGVKKSGYGRFNGIEGLREFSTTKTITINPVHDQYPM